MTEIRCIYEYSPFNFDRDFLSLFSCMPTISTLNSTLCKMVLGLQALLKIHIELKKEHY